MLASNLPPSVFFPHLLTYLPRPHLSVSVTRWWLGTHVANLVSLYLAFISLLWLPIPPLLTNHSSLRSQADVSIIDTSGVWSSFIVLAVRWPFCRLTVPLFCAPSQKCSSTCWLLRFTGGDQGAWLMLTKTPTYWSVCRISAMLSLSRISIKMIFCSQAQEATGRKTSAWPFLLALMFTDSHVGSFDICVPYWRAKPFQTVGGDDHKRGRVGRRDVRCHQDDRSGRT